MTKKQKTYMRRKWLPFPKTQEEVHLIANMTQFIAADEERTKFVCGVFDCGSPEYWPHKKPKNWVPKYWIPFPSPGMFEG